MIVELPVPPWDNVTLAGLADTLGPLGLTAALRFTSPVKPSRLWRFTSMVADDPWATVRVGVAVIEKSAATTLTVTVTECDSCPLVPVTVVV